MIRIEGLCFRYGEGDFQLRIPELIVEAGTTTAFIGPSGSGGSVVFAPTGNRPASGDYLDAMRANVEALEVLPAS
jgi:ABC-type transporter Mla maintaining outer membrane lipid asymmetry ATPase subunit MlaF